MPESEVTLAVLTGLPEDYDVVVTVLSTAGKGLKLDEALPHLLQMEQKISAKEEKVPLYVARHDSRQSRAQ